MHLYWQDFWTILVLWSLISATIPNMSTYWVRADTVMAKSQKWFHFMHLVVSLGVWKQVLKKVIGIWSLIWDSILASCHLKKSVHSNEGASPTHPCTDMFIITDVKIFFRMYWEDPNTNLQCTTIGSVLALIIFLKNRTNLNMKVQLNS